MSSELTVEQQATNFHTMRHIQTVSKLLHRCVTELLKRADEHDESKLHSPEVELFTEFTPKLAASVYGSPEYHELRKQMKPALDHHYANNRHHPEFALRDEEWKAVVGYEGLYEVSSHGNVRSLTRVVRRPGPTGDLTINGRDMELFVTPKGYHRLQLNKDGKKRNHLVHRLVAEAFIPNPEGKPDVNHKDSCKDNNRVSNLEWVTCSENLTHAYEEGLKQANVKYVVECEELGIVTFGCTKMEAELRKRGYDKASSAAIWNVINRGGKHLDLEFTASRFERWMNSPVNDMTLIDLLETFCDWKAASLRHNTGNIRKSIEVNAGRFELSPQLVKILENTARLFDDVKEG